MDPAVVGALVAMASVLTAAIQRVALREKVHAEAELAEVEADVKLIDSAQQVVAMVREQLKELHDEAESLRAEVKHLAVAVEVLTREVHRLGGDPATVLPPRR